ncbi:MAG: exodeoxyribonuclease V subunit gamma [Candidatus Accumulibacter sp.]|nr:exodeoxyribonuclease V subunit gamma [Accumulibacter sp.]
MLWLTLSNRFEYLRETMLERLATEDGSPMVAQQVIVPSSAIRRHLELVCADRHGICANIDFSFLAQWLWSQIARWVPVEQTSPFTPALLGWRIFEILGDRAFVAEQPRLARYLRVADPVMRLELAEQSAQLIEHYITYRPNWLASWIDGQEAGIGGLDASQAADEQWQAALWRRLSADLGIRRQHPATVFFEKVAQFDANAPQMLGLPSTVHVFCLPTLPPLYLEILRQLANWIDIRMYVLNPCREYWFEIVDAKRLRYLAAQRRDAFHEVGNRLLASWGKQTQAHIDLLFADPGQIIEQGSEFIAEPLAATDATVGGGSLLSRIQQAILELRDLAPGSVRLDPDDRSIEVHVCHSLTRELEVLQDQLLAHFTEAATTPAEIVVLLPDLLAAAPLIDAVFGTTPPTRRIAYTITGLPQTRINPIARALDSLMALCDSRFSASAVFGLLMQAPVAARFALGGAELALLHDWIGQVGIRWGIDADSRRRLDLPVSDRHSFADGLHRLFLAYAIGDEPAARQTVIAGRIPAGQPEGQQALTLGRCWQFVTALESVRAEWSQSLAPADWQRSLNEALSRFTACEATSTDDLRLVQAAIGELHVNLVRGGARSELPLTVVHRALKTVLDDPARGGVPSGVLTFAALGSLRALPYRMVCVLGLNDGIFPTAHRPAEFDLLSLQPQRGDRQRRIDERNLFLDLLLSARQRLHLSYSGRNQRDNSPLPPSVLLAELLDYAAMACSTDPENPDTVAAARRRLIVDHPLQPFSSACFAVTGDPRRGSFNAEYALALQQRLTRQAAVSALPVDHVFRDEENGEDDPEHSERTTGEPTLPFFSRALAAPTDDWRQVDLDRLQRFFRNPCRFLLSQRLNIALRIADEPLQDDEPFLVDFPSRRALLDRLLPALLGGADEERARSLALAGNELPGGPFGERLLFAEVAQMHAFAMVLRPKLAVPRWSLPIARFDFTIEGTRWQLAAPLTDLRPNGLLRYRYAKLGAGDYLAGWIEHLFLCACAPEGVELRTEWLSSDGGYRLSRCPADEAYRLLSDLLTLYGHGLRQPLPFFPKSAWAYVTAQGDRLTAARRAWSNHRKFAWGEQADPAYLLAWRGVADPLEARFAELAQRVFEPLLAHLEVSER